MSVKEKIPDKPVLKQKPSLLKPSDAAKRKVTFAKGPGPRPAIKKKPNSNLNATKPNYEKSAARAKNVPPVLNKRLSMPAKTASRQPSQKPEIKRRVTAAAELPTISKVYHHVVATLV